MLHCQTDISHPNSFTLGNSLDKDHSREFLYLSSHRNLFTKRFYFTSYSPTPLIFFPLMCLVLLTPQSLPSLPGAVPVPAASTCLDGTLALACRGTAPSFRTTAGAWCAKVRLCFLERDHRTPVLNRILFLEFNWTKFTNSEDSFPLFLHQKKKLMPSVTYCKHWDRLWKVALKLHFFNVSPNVEEQAVALVFEFWS